MERIIEQGILYDFYGPLLTKHQQEVYEAVVYNDLSLGEIAVEEGISRQGVHDLVRRCDKTLTDYENKLHLVERFGSNKKKLAKLRELLNCLTECGGEMQGKNVGISAGEMSDAKTAGPGEDILHLKQEMNRIIDELMEGLD